MSLEEELQPYRHKSEVTVRFGDIDAVGHVNNARYASYLEQARMAYAREVLSWDGSLNSLNIVLADLHLEFRAPIFLQDSVQVYSRVTRLGGRSFTIE